MHQRGAGRIASIGLLGIFCMAFMAGCGSLSPTTRAEHKIADALPGMIGPAKHYAVRIDGDAFALARGRARRVTVHGEDVQVTSTATLSTLDFTASDISFDAKSRHVDKVGQVNFTATMSQVRLNQYLAQSQAHPGLAVTLGVRDIEARLPVNAGPIHTSVMVRGFAAPTTPNGNTISFAADKARLSILPIPVFLVNRALDQVNPVVDLSGFKVPIAITSTVVQSKTLVLNGTADIGALTASADSS